MKSIDQMTQGELAAFIDSHLKESGIHVVLSGGACVAIYSDHKYVSKDLDFIAQFNLDGKKISAAMKTLGFELKGNYFHHPQTPFFVEFIPGPPSVGQDPIEEIHEKVFATGSLRIISPTDCVKDRLAAYYHWGDRQSLEQAVLVSNSIQVDIDQIENWSTREGKQVEFREFYRRIE
ncbi:MAG: hypothetical protein P8Y68_19885 [Anaerolineales bacterium]